MIKEEYITYNVARKLKTLKADIEYHAYYNEFIQGVTYEQPIDLGETIPAYTQQAVMRWLREVHNFGIYVRPLDLINVNGMYIFDVYNIQTNGLAVLKSGVNNTYEEALMEAIKYCVYTLYNKICYGKEF